MEDVGQGERLVGAKRHGGSPDLSASGVGTGEGRRGTKQICVNHLKTADPNKYAVWSLLAPSLLYDVYWNQT